MSAARQCPVCGVPIRARFLMCADDWALVPYGLARRVSALFQQATAGAVPWKWYINAMGEAVREVRAIRKREGGGLRALTNRQLSLFSAE